MSSPLLEVPSDPLQRFLSIAEAVALKKRWFHGWSVLRYAAIGLTTVPGDPSDVAGRMHKVAQELDENLGWTSSIRGDLRFCLSASILRRGGDGRSFVQTLKRVRSWFREAKLGRSEMHEALATIVLMEATSLGPNSAGPTRDQILRLAEVYRGMRKHHLLFTNSDDYPAAALLSLTGDDLGHIESRLETLYKALRELRFRRGNQLQLATHLLYFANADDRVLAERFRSIYGAFDKAGLYMNTGDYDEVAILSLLEAEPGAIVQRVLENRERMRERLRPKPSKQEGFSLASATTFLALATKNRETQVVASALNFAQLVSLIQAQQAVAAAAAVAAASASAGG